MNGPHLAQAQSESDRPLLEAVEIRKSFGGREVLSGVSFKCEAHNTICIVGPSGSGKSTLLRCLNRLEKQDSGIVILDGEIVGYEAIGNRLVERTRKDISRQQSQMGMVFQSFNLFPHLTALENIVLPQVTVRGTPRAEAEDNARAYLDRVGVASHADQFARVLSGGQQQRVAIARALAMKPKVLLFDEPTSALDPELVGEVLSVMAEVAAEGMASVIVTHEIQFAEEVADDLIFMDGGVIVEQGPPREVIRQPRNDRTKSFMARLARQ